MQRPYLTRMYVLYILMRGPFTGSRQDIIKILMHCGSTIDHCKKQLEVQPSIPGPGQIFYREILMTPLMAMMRINYSYNCFNRH